MAGHWNRDCVEFSEAAAAKVIEAVRKGESDWDACKSAGVFRKHVTGGHNSWYEQGRIEGGAEPYVSFADELDDAREERRQYHTDQSRARYMGQAADAILELRRWYTEVLVGHDEYLVVDADGRVRADMNRLLADGRVKVKRISETSTGKQCVEFYGADDAARGLERLLGVAERIDVRVHNMTDDELLAEAAGIIAKAQDDD